jgi:hypothetical protein
MTPQELEELKKQIATVSAENISLKERVDVLEQATRRRRWSRIILGVMVFSAVLGYAFVAGKTFSGRWLAVHDEEGHIRAWLDDSGLELKDAEGNVRAKLDDGGLTLKDAKGNVRAALAVGPDGWPMLQVSDGEHKAHAELFLFPGDGGAYLMIWDKDGKGHRYPPSKTPMP